MTEPLELVVIEGKKQGARTTLQFVDGITEVGVGYDCDVVLDLPNVHQAPGGVADLSPVVQLIAENGQLKLKVINGSVTAGDSVLQAQEDTELGKNIPVKMLNNVFMIQSPSESCPATNKQATDAQSINEVSGNSVVQSGEFDEHSAEQVELAQQQKNRVFNGALQSLLGVLVLVGAVVVTYFNQKPAIATSEEVMADVQMQMQAAGFDGLHAELQEDKTVRVYGYLDNRLMLRQAKEEMQFPDVVQWDVTLGDSLLESVSSVFRVNGLEAQVKMVAEGVVSVNTKTNDLELLERVEQSVYTDVPDLKELKLTNDAPPVKIEETPQAPIENTPGKRIVMIVASDPTYIQTEDGSRYFEGSILPSGHLVMAILDESVQLQLEDKKIELTF